MTTDEFEETPSFSEWIEIERRESLINRQHWFIVLAMFFYTAIRISAFVCASIVILDGYAVLGGLLFGLSLFMRFEFKTADSNGRENVGTHILDTPNQ